jgi:hypothetical protein
MVGHDVFSSALDMTNHAAVNPSMSIAEVSASKEDKSWISRIGLESGRTTRRMEVDLPKHGARPVSDN